MDPVRSDEYLIRKWTERGHPFARCRICGTLWQTDRPTENYECPACWYKQKIKQKEAERCRQ